MSAQLPNRCKTPASPSFLVEGDPTWGPGEPHVWYISTLIARVLIAALSSRFGQTFFVFKQTDDFAFDFSVSSSSDHRTAW